MRCAKALMLFLACGCISTTERRLPAYDVAISMGGPDHPKLFYAETLDWDVLPVVTPYAVIIATSDGRVSMEAVARRVWQESTKLKADIVGIFRRGTVYAGSVSTYYGFGISTSQPVYQPVYDGVCFRVNPALIGFRTDPTGMVLTIDDGSNARSAGLLEGDRILSVNGTAYIAGESNPALLKIKPGDDVKLVWIRSGTGRMEGVAKAVENRNTHLEMRDAIEWVPPPRHRQETTVGNEW